MVEGSQVVFDALSVDFLITLGHPPVFEVILEVVLQDGDVVCFLEFKGLLVSEGEDLEFLRPARQAVLKLAMQELGIAAGHEKGAIVANPHRGDGFLEFADVLYLIDEDVVLLIILHQSVEAFLQLDSRGDALAAFAFQIKVDDMLLIHAFGKELPFNLKQKLRLPAAPDPRDGFNVSGIVERPDFLEIGFSDNRFWHVSIVIEKLI